MPKFPTPFVEMVLEQMRPIGPVRARAMLGGWGIFHDDLMFALVADDELYFKTDDGNRAIFESRELTPFVYEARGKPVTMSYYRVPEEVFDEEKEMAQWANLALAAALRTRGCQTGA